MVGDWCLALDYIPPVSRRRGESGPPPISIESKLPEAAKLDLEVGTTLV